MVNYAFSLVSFTNSKLIWFGVTKHPMHTSIYRSTQLIRVFKLELVSWELLLDLTISSIFVVPPVKVSYVNLIVTA